MLIGSQTIGSWCEFSDFCPQYYKQISEIPPILSLFLSETFLFTLVYLIWLKMLIAHGLLEIQLSIS